MVYKGFISMTVLWLLSGFFCYASESDSLGVETKDNQIFVLHQVEAKETLYSLSNRYGSSVADIVEHNQISDNNLTIGAILRIPWSGAVIHTVVTGETLYSISRDFKVSVADLKKYNNLKSNDLEVGQQLTIVNTNPDSSTDDGRALGKADNVDRLIHVVAPKETLYSISRKHGFSLEPLRQWNDMESNDVQIGDTIYLDLPPKAVKEQPEQHLVKTASITTIPDESKPVKTSYTPQKDLTAVTETGVAAVIDGSTDTKKYLALHPTAPVGTIMRVRNEMTNLSVFVRVVGKLPATGANNNVLIRLSEAAQTALGALDEKFRVELSYVPNQ